MASNANRGRDIFDSLMKMLVLFILMINTAHLCQGKALLEEAESNRGERSYGHLPNSGLHQTYDSQSNAEHWMKGKFYQPQVNGQPIYVPAVEQPASYNEFLDAYYKAYTPPWNPATSAPYTYDTKNTGKTVTKSTFDKDSFKYTLPTLKESKFSVDMSTSETDPSEYEDYNGFEDADKTIVAKLTKGKSEAMDELEILTESLKNPQLPKTKPKDNQYNQLVAKTTQKSMANSAEDVQKNTRESVIKGAFDKDGVKYESPISKVSEFSDGSSNSDEYDLNSEDYDSPDIPDKTIATEFNDEKSDIASNELDNEEKFEEPVVHESLKSELTKPKDRNQYDIPVIVKTIEQKPKINNKIAHKKLSTPKNTKKTVIKGTSDKDGVKYVFPVSKESEFSVEMSPSDYDLEYEDYGDPKIIDKTIATELNGEKSDMASELENQEEFEEPVVREYLKKSELTKTKPKDRNQYVMPVVKTFKPKTNNAEKGSHKISSAPKNVYKSTAKNAKGSDKDGVKYEFPASKYSQFSEDISTSEDYDLESEDYDSPNIVDKTIATEFSNEKSDMTSNELENQTKFEEAVVHESLKKSELTKTIPKDHNQYGMPVVVKTVKQKPKTKSSKDSQKTSSAPKILYKSTEKNTAKGSDKKDSVKYESPATKQSEFSVEMNTSDDYDLESEDYDGSEVIDRTATEFSNEKLDMTSDLTNDGIKELVFDESIKSELSETKSKDYNQYDIPVVKTNLNTKTYAKKSTQKKQNAQKTMPQLEYDGEQTLTVKTKLNKQIATASAQKCDKISQGTLKKSKGKRRKQYSKSNSRTDEAVDKEILDSNTINEESNELSNTHIKTQKNKVVKTKPVKPKEKVITKPDSQYESGIVKSNSKYKPTKTDKNSKPVTAKGKVVAKTDTQYKPIKNKVTLKSDSGDKPAKESIKYTSELEKEDVLTRKLNTQEKDLPENDINISNTDNLLKNESDLGASLYMSEGEFSAKLNSESSTIKGDLNLETSNSDVLMKPESIVPDTNDFRGLSSMNSNIWSMIFNPNAEQNKLKLKRCITRNNETGFCTYIQNCEVPHIASSLEQLLNNACVIDDIFIGVCCPEFPVQTIKVHWDQTPSDSDNSIEDEFGHIAEDCGIRSNEALELQSWPWKAPLVSMSNGKIFCGGVVVSEDHVLTAAHCTTKIPKNQILVRLGQYDDESGDDYAVVEIKRHAQYNPKTMQNDIALLKLGRRIMNDAHIGIVCLPDEHQQNNHNGEIATLLGWRGIFATKSRDPEFLRVISNKECENKLGMKVTSTLLCTETRKENERTCNADSGTPLVIEEDGRYEVIGILSWNRNDCDQRFPSTFSRVSSYDGWIKNHIE